MFGVRVLRDVNTMINDYPGLCRHPIATLLRQYLSDRQPNWRAALMLPANLPEKLAFTKNMYKPRTLSVPC